MCDLRGQPDCYIDKQTNTFNHILYDGHIDGPNYIRRTDLKDAIYHIGYSGCGYVHHFAGQLYNIDRYGEYVWENDRFIYGTSDSSGTRILFGKAGSNYREVNNKFKPLNDFMEYK